MSIAIGIIGLGTVGSGTVKILFENQSLIKKRLGCPLIIKKIAVRDPSLPRLVEVPDTLLTTDVESLFRDPDIKIVVELIGGLEPARTFILQAIKAGKHVVTANKAVLAEYGQEIFKAAKEAGVDVAFEAAVGGGIPIIKTLKESLAGNRILSLTGIVNGTCNYILTRMTEENISFEEVLSQAQKAGYAEADPSLDIDGLDAAHKLVILTTLAYGTEVSIDDIYVEGIRNIEPTDIAFAKEFGFVTKLLAMCKETEEGLEVRVHPTLIPEKHVLASVRMAYNAFYIRGDAVGDVLLYGLGAGQLPTGSAVVSDIIDLARNVLSGGSGRVPPLSYQLSDLARLPIKPMDKVVCRYYFRFSVLDRPGVLSKIAGILGQNNISIASVIQKGREEKGPVPIVMLTHEAREASVRKALEEIDQLNIVIAPTKFLRIEKP
ncbi:homoserine dehydrogenase [Thermodesulfatator indicus DSM 15286]|uniref:Homoserine dehydrogenase n=1 Tax=Thermodesulfatator indicus (strain DSM 15286 / JCM 11887 / CIR29812) TaxID=667014 RepID=F8ABP8_THEID|nr:homoserine dehydrogenase [Thermodesulfatator indicus]AEH44500.1 homoserine dehydrogenase [Thermodesulfatator indicus DSM 15286]